MIAKQIGYLDSSNSMENCRCKMQNMIDEYCLLFSPFPSTVSHPSIHPSITRHVCFQKLLSKCTAMLFNMPLQDSESSCFSFSSTSSFSILKPDKLTSISAPSKSRATKSEFEAKETAESAPDKDERVRVKPYELFYGGRGSVACRATHSPHPASCPSAHCQN